MGSPSPKHRTNGLQKSTRRLCAPTARAPRRWPGALKLWRRLGSSVPAVFLVFWFGWCGNGSKGKALGPSWLVWD